MNKLAKYVYVVVIITLASIWVMTHSIIAGLDNPSVVNLPQPPPPKALSVKSRLLFGGDVFWGRQFERVAPNDYSFPFSGLKTLHKEDYDAWIVNFECPITDKFVSFEDQWNAIQFNCHPEYLTEAAKWFDIVSLANNHTNNVRGLKGFNETQVNLETSEIQHFGHYEPSRLDDLCEVVTINARVRYEDGTMEASKLPIAMCGYHGVFRLFTDEEIAQIAKYSKYFITFVMPHAGAEYEPSSDQIRRDEYRAMIDQGADAVFGNHPHWTQNTEAYKGKLIAYSMGNFIFDQQFSPEVTRSALFDVTITFNFDDNIRRYLNMASSCEEFKDKCLERATNNLFVKPKFDISYDAVATRTTNFVTELDTAGLASILNRLDWENTLAGLE